MAKEKIDLKRENQMPIYKKVEKQHMNTCTYAPDLVKWTKRDYAKLLKEKKEEN